MADINTGRKPFIQLTDVPFTYAASALRVVRVNAGMTGLEFAALNAVLSFLDLTDTPNSYAGFGTNRVTVNSLETGLQFVADTFLEEQDTPNSYLGQAGNFVNVNPGETALQFVAPGVIAGAIAPLLIPEITNKGKQWIQHGDNVITLRSAQLDNNFRAKATIFLPLGATDISASITYRGVFHAGSAQANPMTITARPDTTTRLKVRLNGGFGYSSGGFEAAVSNRNDRYDDITNVQTARLGIIVARQMLGGFSLNGYGFVADGRVVASTGVVDRFDEAANTQAARAVNVARDSISAFTINGYGFTTTGWDTVSASNIDITERFDDITNTHTTRTGLVFGRNSRGQFGLNNFGFVLGGSDAAPLDGSTATVSVKFDDISNSWTTIPGLSTLRQALTGFSLDGFGFASGGATAAGVALSTNERFDDVTSIWSAMTGITARSQLAAYCLNGYGFIICGNTGTLAAPANSGVEQRYDNVANTQTARVATAARRALAGYATNEYFVEYNTENVSEFDEIVSLGTAWIAHGDNVITLGQRHVNLDFRSEVVLQLPLGATSVADPITYRGPAHSRPMAITCRPDDPFVGFGFTSGGFTAAIVGTTERYDDPTQVTTTRTALNTARQGLTGYSFNGFGFTSGGTTGAVTGATERLDDSANVQTVRTSVVARRHLASFVVTEGNGIPLNNLGHTICGFIAVVTTDTHEEFDDIANLQTIRSVAGLSTRDKLAAFSVNQFGFGVGGTITDVVGGITNVNERYDLIADIWSSRAVLPANRMELAGFAFGGFGYVSGGTVDAVAMLTATDRYDNVADAWTLVGAMNTARDQLADWAISGFGFAACGNTGTDAAPANSSVLNRYDPSTTAWTARVPAPAFTARRDLAAYSNPTIDTTNGTRLLVRLHGGFGFTTGGYADVGGFVGITERYDDIANTQLIRTSSTDPLGTGLATWSANGLGFAAFGENPPGTNINSNDRYDDVLNTHTGRTTVGATLRKDVAGYSLNGFGITTCGFIAANTGITEKYDDTTNTWTSRTSATARSLLVGYSLNNFGFSSGGLIAASTGVTERFDDSGNFHVTRTSIIARQALTGYSLNGFGFTSCGFIAAITGTTERFDDIANIQAGRANARARQTLAGYSLNGFGFTSCGFIAADTGLTERFDDIANIHTGVTAASVRRQLAGYSTNEYFVNYSTMD